MSACNSNFGSTCGGQSNACPDEYNCISGICPDFTIRRHDLKPDFKVKIDDCDGPMDLTNLVLEVNMWAKGKLKRDICPEDTYFSLANNIGFNQIMIGDVIIMDRIRMPEKMLVVGFDEDLKYVKVQRGYAGTIPDHYKKGTGLRIMRIVNAPAKTEMVFDDINNIDGTITENQLMSSYLIYEWQPQDTCLPGCYWLEFKLLKMVDISSIVVSSVTPNGADGEVEVYTSDSSQSFTSFTGLPDVETYQDISCVSPSLVSFTDISLTPTSFGCDPGVGVDWVRRFPVGPHEGFYIKIFNSPTAEY